MENKINIAEILRDYAKRHKVIFATVRQMRVHTY